MESAYADEHFERGMAQFNREEFFAAHETWEEIWLAAPEPDKTFLQGIIQVAAAFHHFQRGNCAGTQSLMTAGLAKIEPFPADYRGLQLAPLRRTIQDWLAALANEASPTPIPFPRIQRDPQVSPEKRHRDGT